MEPVSKLAGSEPSAARQPDRLNSQPTVNNFYETVNKRKLLQDSC